MNIYNFKVYNSIGNIFNVGRMVGTRKEVEDFCKEEIKKALVNSNGNWSYDVERVIVERKPRTEIK